MATAVTEDNPPALAKFLRDRGINDQNTIRQIERRAKSGNWEGHWRKHHRTVNEVLVEREENTIRDLTTQYAERRENLLRQQFDQVEQMLPELIQEALNRKDFMDDKALVQLIKVLIDSRKDIIHNLQEILGGGGGGNNGVGGSALPLPLSSPVGTNMRLVALGVAVLEAKERGIDPASVIDAEFSEEATQRDLDAFRAIDAMLNDE